MRTEEVAENIHRIPIRLPNNPLKELNSYYIRDKDRSLLIDTGFPLDECREDLLAGLAELGEEAGNVDFFLTHMHADHSGLASQLVGKDRRVMISEIDRGWLLGNNTAIERWNRYTGSFIAAGMPEEIVRSFPFLNPAIRFAPRADHFIGVGDGHIIRAGGYAFRCVLTHGHTPGHMCLWDETNRLMFTGDHVLFDITPNITAWSAMDNTLGKYLDSLKAVLQYPVRTALPGHRKTGDFSARIEELLMHHENRLAEILSIVRNEPKLTAYEISGKMKWRIRAANWLEFPATQKIFAVGECMTHLDYLMRCGKLSMTKPANLELYSMI